MPSQKLLRQTVSQGEAIKTSLGVQWQDTIHNSLITYYKTSISVNTQHRPSSRYLAYAFTSTQMNPDFFCEKGYTEYVELI